MSYKITRRKKANKQSYCYSVLNTRSRKIFSKCTTKKKATKQKRLLNALRYNKNFVTNKKKAEIERQRIKDAEELELFDNSNYD